jgi:pyrimidine-specific ribonucleoside hydrolase
MDRRWTLPFVIAALTAVIFSRTAVAAPRERIVISTDLATGLQGGWRAGVSDVDDGFAVAMAYYSKRFDLRGVIVTFGNDYRDPEIVVADRLLGDLMKVQIPVLEGAAVPLSDPPAQWTTTAPPSLVEDTCANAGVRFMKEELEKGPLTILALGPLTDVACLVTRFPDLSKKNLKNVVAIMGRQPNESFAITGKTGLTDFNMRRDSQAAKVLLEGSQVPVTFIGFSATSKGLISSQAVEEKLAADKSPLAQFFLLAARAWIRQWQAFGFAEDGFHPWDQNAVYYAMKPEAYVCDARGFAFIDCTPKPGEKENACAGHAAGVPLDSQGEHWQLWFSPDYATRKVRYCHDYVSDQAKADFLKATLAVVP